MTTATNPESAPESAPESPTPRAGYTLPVFACASAIAALQHLQGHQAAAAITLDLITPAKPATIPIEQVATLPDGSALAISRSDPGDNLDLTRDTPIWAVVAWGEAAQADPVHLIGGEGIGRQQQGQGEAAIYAYARRLLTHNLSARLATGEKIQVTLILPDGKALATRTSNAAFGVVEGLSLLGTTGISQPLSAPGQLDAFRQDLRRRAQQYDDLVFCLGENGLDLSLKLGIQAERRLKTANWLGPLLVEAGQQGVKSVLLFGYHGKLLKLAGGIFHTHHHVADGRQEILAAHCGALGLPQAKIEAILNAATAEAALALIRQFEAETGEPWVERVYGALATAIDQRATAYVQNHCDRTPSPLLSVGCLLFDRDRNPIIISQTAATLLPRVC
jgi:cobalt-precorrin-5B (C1)-methyltransferase